MLEHMLRDWEMGRGSIPGLMVKNSKENGRKVKKTAMVFGNRQKVIFMKESGRIINKMEKDSLLILEDPSIVDILRIFWNMVEAKRNLRMEISILDNTNMENLMGMENISGQTEIPTRANSLKDQEKAKELWPRKMPRATKDVS